MKRPFSLTPVMAMLVTLVTSSALAQAPRDSTQSTPATTAAPAKDSTANQRPTGATAPATTPSRAATDPDRTRYAGMKDSESWERAHRASKIIGMDVVNRQGDKIGDIEDIVLDKKGTIAYAVVSTGGFLGIGDRLHAVPWQSIQTNTGKDNFILDIDRERLRSAPGFDKNNWPNLADDKWSTENSRYFPRPHSSSSSSTGTAMPSATGRAGATTGPAASTSTGK